MDILLDVNSLKEWKQMDWYRDIGLLETSIFVIGVYAFTKKVGIG